MSTLPPPRLHHNVDPKLIEEYLNKGGKITKLEYGDRSEEINFVRGFYGRGRKKAKVAENQAKDEDPGEMED
jgi:hypothetical protein